LEHDNLRAALDWSNTKGDGAAGLWLAAGLWQFWFMRGNFAEGRRWLEETLARSDPSRRTRARAYELGALGCLTWVQGDYGLARARLEESAAIYQELGDMPGYAYALNWLAMVTTELGHPHAARALAQKAVELCRAREVQWYLAHSLFVLGRTIRESGEYAAAVPIYEESIARFRTLGDQ
jgi:tetratricopeptide (TPR) repeat protein